MTILSFRKVFTTVLRKYSESFLKRMNNFIGYIVGICMYFTFYVYFFLYPAHKDLTHKWKS